MFHKKFKTLQSSFGNVACCWIRESGVPVALVVALVPGVVPLLPLLLVLVASGDFEEDGRILFFLLILDDNDFFLSSATATSLTGSDINANRSKLTPKHVG